MIACAVLARRARARASAIDARSRSVAGLGAGETAMAKGRGVGRQARMRRTVPYCPRADNGGIMPSVRSLRAIVRDGSDIPHDVPTDNTALVCARRERDGLGLRSRRGAGPAGGDGLGDLLEGARRARQSHRDHLQVPGRRQRAGLRSGLPRLRPLPRRRRGTHVDRRPRSRRADVAVEARAGGPVQAHDVHPGARLHRRRGSPARPVLDTRSATPDADRRGHGPAVLQRRDARLAAPFRERVPPLQGRLASGRGRRRQHHGRVAVVEEGRHAVVQEPEEGRACSTCTPTTRPRMPSRRAWRSRSTAFRWTPSP